MLNYTKWKELEFKNDNIAFEEAVNRKYFTLAICLNFTENNQHGCDAGCKFCHWRSLNFNPYLCPSNELLIEFINKFSKDGGIVELTGGGDPLYNFEKNKHEVKRLIDTIVACGRQAKIVTRRIDIVKKYADSEYLKDVLHYNFSTEILDKSNLTFFKSLLDKGISIRVSKVYNYGPDNTSVNYEDIYNTINFYNQLNDSNFRLTLRSNYSYPTFDFISERYKLDKYTEEHDIKINVKLNGIVIHLLQLIGNDVLYCSNTEDYLKIFNRKKQE